MTRAQALRAGGYARSPLAPNQEPRPKLSAFEFLMECIGWLQIAVSPFLLGLLAGSFVYFASPGPITLVACVTLSVIGAVAGAIWATRVWKRRGTIWFMSRIMATPELDTPDGVLTKAEQPK